MAGWVSRTGSRSTRQGRRCKTRLESACLFVSGRRVRLHPGPREPNDTLSSMLDGASTRLWPQEDRLASLGVLFWGSVFAHELNSGLGPLPQRPTGSGSTGGCKAVDRSWQMGWASNSWKKESRIRNIKVDEKNRENVFFSFSPFCRVGENQINSNVVDRDYSRCRSGWSLPVSIPVPGASPPVALEI